MGKTAKQEIWNITGGQRVGLQGPRALTSGEGNHI